MKTAKGRLIVLLSLVLTGGYLVMTLVSHGVSVEAVRRQIRSETLPLTRENIYSGIRRDLLRPVLISSIMASDTFLRDWLIAGERDKSVIQKYLRGCLQRPYAFGWGNLLLMRFIMAMSTMASLFSVNCS